MLSTTQPPHQFPARCCHRSRAHIKGDPSLIVKRFLGEKLQTAETVFRHRVGDLNVDLIDPVERLLIEDEVGGSEALFKLGQGGGPDDGAGDKVVLAAPSECKRGDTNAEIIGDLFQADGGFECAIIDEALGHSLLTFGSILEVVREAGPGGEGTAVVLAGQDPTAEGRVRQEADALHPADLSQFAFATAIDQGEIVLDRIKSSESVFFGGPEILHESPGRFVAAAKGADFALILELGERGKGFFLPHAVIRPVGLVEVDVVGSQACEAVFAGGNDLVPIQRSHAMAHGRSKPAMAGSSYFRGENQSAAVLSFEPFANDFLGDAEELGIGWDGIQFGSVEEIDPGIDGAIHDGKRGGLVCLEAEGHGAKANIGNYKGALAQASMLHAKMVRKVAVKGTRKLTPRRDSATYQAALTHESSPTIRC